MTAGSRPAAPWIDTLPVMDYASPAEGLYVFNGVLEDAGVVIPCPLVKVYGESLFVAVKDGQNYWRYDKDDDVIIAASNDGVDYGFVTGEIVTLYEIALEPDDSLRVNSVTKSSVTGRIG